MTTQQIGQTAFQVAGSAIGAYFGGPVGSMVGGMAGGLIGSLIFGRKTKPMVADVQVMNSNYGRSIPIVYGTARLPGMVIWQDDITTGTKGIGKGGSTGSSSSYSYWQSAAVAFCEGPASIKKLFLDGKLFFDTTALNPQEYTKYRFTIRTYYGYDDQVADPLMVQWVNSHTLPSNSCPDYHGLAYLVFDRPDLKHFGNRFPQATAIWTTSPTRTTLFSAALQTFDPSVADQIYGGSVVNGIDKLNALGVDWARNVAYFLEVRGAKQAWVRAFDLLTGREIMETNWDQMFGDDGTTIPPGNPTYDDGTVGGMSLAQGGSLYLWSGLQHFRQWIATLNPDTLAVVSVKQYLPSTSGLLGSVIMQLVAFTVITTDGPVDMLIGWTLFPFKYFLLDPTSGDMCEMDTPTDHLYTSKTATLGTNDPEEGLQEVWCVCCEYEFVPGQRIYIYKATVRGANVLGFGDSSDNWAQVGVLTPESVGVPPDTDGSSFYGVFLDWIAWHKADDSLIIRCYGKIFKWNQYTGVGWITDQNNGPFWGGTEFSTNDLGYMAFPYDGSISSGGVRGSFGDLDLITGQTRPSPSPIDATISPFGHWISSSYGNMVLYNRQGGLWYIAYLNRIPEDEYAVAEIIRDLCRRVGVTDDMIDVSLVTQTTPGYVIQENKSAGMCISDLLHVYQIDMVESDFKLKFIPRGQGAAVSVPQADLISVDTSDPSQYWRTKEAQQQEMPLQMVVRFQDPALDFESGATYARRTELPVHTTFSKRRTTVDLPVVVSSLQARQIADRWLWTMWAERYTAETTLSPKYLFVDPGDNITVTFDNGDVITTRVEEQTIATDMSMHLQLAYEDLTVYDPAPNLKGATTSRQPQTIVAAPFGALLQFNVPLLQDTDDTGGISTRIYYAVGAYGGGWSTGELFISTDRGVSWDDMATMATASDWGHATTTLNDTPSKFATDIANSVTVAPMPGSSAPVNCSYDDMLSGANAALLGQEIIQYQFAADNHNGTFTLSNLLRGRRGTEWATDTHGTGELFLPLVLGKLGARTQPLPSIGVQALYKLVPQGRFLDQAPTDPYTYRGYDLMPYAPVMHKRALVSGNLVLTWVRRTRMGGPLLDGTDTAPLYESSELYNAYILSGPAAIALFNPANPLSYMRSYMSLPTPTCTYTAAQMTSDGFYPATSFLYLVVYQVSSVVGMGFQSYAVLPPY